MNKPQNTAPVLKDKLINLFVDWSAGLVNTGKPFFVDHSEDYEIKEVSVLHSVAYIANQAVTMSVGYTDGPSGAASATRFVNAQSMGTSGISVGVKTVITQTTNLKLPKGHGLTVTCAAAASQTGEGVIQVRLRPMERLGAASKRPGGAAQATS